MEITLSIGKKEGIKKEILDRLNSDIELLYFLEKYEAHLERIANIDNIVIDSVRIVDIDILSKENDIFGNKKGIDLNFDGVIRYSGDEDSMDYDYTVNLFDLASNDEVGFGEKEDIKYAYLINVKAYFIAAEILRNYGYYKFVVFSPTFFESFDDEDKFEKFYSYKFKVDDNKNYIIKSFDRIKRKFIDINGNEIEEKEIINIFDSEKDYYEFIGEYHSNNDIHISKLDEIDVFYKDRLIGLLRLRNYNKRDMDLFNVLIDLVKDYIGVYIVSSNQSSNQQDGIIVIYGNGISILTNSNNKQLINRIKEKYSNYNNEDVNKLLIRALKDNINKVVKYDNIYDNIEELTKLYKIMGKNKIIDELGQNTFYKLVYLNPNKFGFNKICKDSIYQPKVDDSSTIYGGLLGDIGVSATPKVPEIIVYRYTDVSDNVINAIRIFPSGKYEEIKFFIVENHRQTMYIPINYIKIFLLAEYNRLEDKVKQYISNFLGLKTKNGDVLINIDNTEYLLKEVLKTKSTMGLGYHFVVEVYNLNNNQYEIKILDENMKEVINNLVDKATLLEGIIPNKEAILGYIEGKAITKVFKILKFKGKKLGAVVKVKGDNKLKIIDIKAMKFVEPTGKKDDKIEIVLDNKRFYMDKKFKLSKNL